MDKLILVLHVAAAVFIVGPMAILPHTGLRALRGGDPKQVTGLARSVNVFSYLSLIVFILGFAALGLAPASDHISFTTTWIWLSVVLYAIAFVLSAFVVVPRMRAGATELEASPGVKPKAYGAVVSSAGITTLLLVVVVVLMVWHP